MVDTHCMSLQQELELELELERLQEQGLHKRGLLPLVHLHHVAYCDNSPLY